MVDSHSRDRNANHLGSESESVICMQLNNSHNIVLLERHSLKNILTTFFFTAHKVWGENIHVDSISCTYFLSEFFSSSDSQVLESLKCYHIFMTLRHIECHRVYFCLLRILPLHWYDRRKDYTSGHNNSLVIAEVTSDLPALQLQTPIYCAI